jgi:hypothetical protein
MYQPLIWAAVLGDEAGGLGAAFDAENLERLANALIDGVGRNSQLDGDFLRREMFGDKPQTIKLARR